MALLNKTKIEIAKKGAGAEPTGWKTLPACTNLPDMGVDAEFVETTTIDDDQGTNELGVGSAGDVVYTFRLREIGDADGNEPAFDTLEGLQESISAEQLYTIRNTFKSGRICEFDVSGVALKILGGGLNDVHNFEASFGLASKFRNKKAVAKGAMKSTGDTAEQPKK